MSDEAMVTERDAVERERAAYTEGAKWAWRTNYAECTGARFNHNGHVDRAAAYRYPLPTITRPRVVKDPHSADIVWRCDGGVLQYRQGNHEWSMGPGYWYAFPERVRLWADLLANPTEEVDG